MIVVKDHRFHKGSHGWVCVNCTLVPRDPHVIEPAGFAWCRRAGSGVAR